MPKVGFLLGAGASYPFGVPMMRQFYEQFIAYIRLRRAHCLPLIEQLAGATPIPDLELLIERLEQVRAVRPALGLLGHDGNGLAEQLSLADDLRGYLDMFLIETCERFDESKVKEKLSKFVKVAQTHGAYIFTTNYDRLIEVAATSAGIDYSDGFESSSSRPESKWNGQFSEGIPLIKLHGSVNWYQEEDGQNLFRLERGYSLPSHEYRLTHGARALRPLMIIPTLEKAVLKQPYSGLLTQFSDALKEIDVLVVVGNSLRDDHLRNTVIARAAGLNIILVNPAAQEQTGIVNRPISTHAVPLGIEQFIDLGLATFDSLLSNLAQLNTSDHISTIAKFAGDITILADQAHGLNDSESRQLASLRGVTIDATLESLKMVSQFSHPAIVAEVRNLAVTSVDESIRIAAIDAFVDARGADSADILADIVRSRAPTSVRAEAALALRSLESNSAVAEIVRQITPALVGERAIHAIFDHAIR